MSHNFFVIATLTAAVFACATSAHAAPAASSLRVNFAGIDLATASGQAQATARLVQAVRLSCERVEEMDDLSRHENYLACVDATLTQATPHLARLISRSKSVQLAGNGLK
jgi:UrcA family protein